jgi:hypothetical protein
MLTCGFVVSEARMAAVPERTGCALDGRDPDSCSRPATINHRLAVLSSFYEFAGRTGAGPSLNPVLGAGPGDRPFVGRPRQ